MYCSRRTRLDGKVLARQIDQVLDRAQSCNLFSVDADAQGCVQQHREIDDVQRIGTQVVHQRGFGRNGGKVKVEDGLMPSSFKLA